MSNVKPIPDDFTILTPMLVCRDASAEMEFCSQALDAVELVRRPGPDGEVAHGLMAIGEARVMIEREWPGIASRPPALDGSSPVALYLYVPDVDATVERAVTAGARVLMPVEDRFWGDRTARIVDPSGHVWTLATRIEETSGDERTGRWSALLEDRVDPAG
jgi:PhnB protein